MNTKSTAQLHCSGLTVERGGAVIVRDVTLTVAPRDRIGLVGPNGSGKSTLLEALAGRLEPRAGSVGLMPTGATAGLLAQELDAVDGETVADHIARQVGVAAASEALDQATDALAANEAGAVDAHRGALDHWIRLGGADLDNRLDTALVEVGFPISLRSVDVTRLSGGEQARVGLAVLLLARFDVLLLDEPTNNLDRQGLEQLEAFVARVDTPLVVVSHDRRFLDRTVNAVIEIDDHDRTVARYNGSWADYLTARDVARAQAARRYEDFRSERSQLEQRARQQREWATRGVQSERKNPPDNDRAARGFRIEKTEKLASKARRTERAIERLDEVDKPWEPWRLQFSIGQAERSGKIVAELRDAEVALGSFRLGPITLTVSSGDRVAVLGDNGAGKTTLIRALLGEQPLTGGTHRLGRSVLVGRLGQDRGIGSDERPFLDSFTAETGLTPTEARSLLAKFGLDSDHLTRPAAGWSPGERTRATLAAFQATGVNTLVVDEPTNHLDLPAIEQLEQALDRFEGTLILITHDRAFLDNTRTDRRIEVASGRIVVDEPVSGY